jgi:hypothetical protein
MQQPKLVGGATDWNGRIEKTRLELFSFRIVGRDLSRAASSRIRSGVMRPIGALRTALALPGGARKKWWRRIPRCPAAIRNSLGRVSRSSSDGIPFQLDDSYSSVRPFVFTSRLKIIAAVTRVRCYLPQGCEIVMKALSALFAHLVRSVASAGSRLIPSDDVPGSEATPPCGCRYRVFGLETKRNDDRLFSVHRLAVSPTEAISTGLPHGLPSRLQG